MASPNDDESSDLHILATSSKPVAIGYDLLTRRVYWSDVQDRAVYSVSIDNVTNVESLMTVTDGVGLIDGKACV